MAHPDLDDLLDHCLRFAQRMLAGQGEFFPFGASIEEGKVLMSDGIQIEEEHPPSQKVIDEYTAIYRARASSGGLRAAAICWDCEIVISNGTRTDAISVGLEHRNGESANVCLPYTKNLPSGYEYGDLVAYRREAQFFKATELSYWPVDMNKAPEVVQRFSALIDQQETMASQPEFAQTYVFLGNEYQKIGQPETAAATWQIGLTKFPNDPTLQKKISGQ